MVKKSDLKGEFELEELRHKHKMDEATYLMECQKKVEALAHENKMSQIRLKSANIERGQMRKQKSYENQSY